MKDSGESAEAPVDAAGASALSGPPDSRPELREATWDAVKIHASTKKSLKEVGFTVWHVYRVVDIHGWLGVMDIMGWDEARMRKLAEALEQAGLPVLPDDGVRREARQAREKRRALCRTCGKREKAKGKQKCQWCWLLAQPIEDQIRHAEIRLELTPEDQRRARVPADEWPGGERWCAGCQTMVPTFYATGSRCKACASKAAHSTRLKAIYGITREEYEQLLEYQDGCCYICRRTARSRRLAVDHDHKSGEVRGLLCSDNERGCNHAILGNISGIEMARRIVDYLEEPPARRLFGAQVGRVEPAGSTVNDEGVEIFDPFGE